MHEVKILNIDQFTVTLEIDGKTIQMTRKGNFQAVEDPQIISEDLDALLDATKRGCPLSSIDFHLSGTNVIRLIDAFCLEDALAAWEAFASREMPLNGKNRAFFFQYLGFTISNHLTDSLFNSRGTEISNTCKLAKVLEYRQQKKKAKQAEQAARMARKAKKHKPEKPKEPKHPPRKLPDLRTRPFQSKNICIEYGGENNNVITYLVNGTPISICLSGRSKDVEAASIYQAIITIEQVFINEDLSILKPIIRLFGGKAVLNIMVSLYMEQTKKLVNNLVRKQCIGERQLPTPRRIIKTTFRYTGEFTPLMNELLDAAEELIPQAGEHLVASSEDEISKDKDEWILYSYMGEAPQKYRIVFDFKDNLSQELREYLRQFAFYRIKSKTEYVAAVYRVWSKISLAIKALSLQGVELDSILQLRPSDCIYLQTYFAQNSGMAIKTQRDALFALNRFYTFHAKKNDVKKEESPFSCLHLPQFVSTNHIQPITPEALQIIADKVSLLPEHTRIAFTIAVITGGRSNEICHLKADCLVHDEEGYKIIIYHHKAEIPRTMENKPNYTKHDIPEKFGHVIEKYIESTQSLRERLDEPYLLVYQPKCRDNTKRLPRVLQAPSFSDQIHKLVEDTPLYHTDGTPVRCNFSNIRAEVGRAMFAKGATADEVAMALGNTPQVAATHYNTMNPLDEAKLYNRHYNETFASARKVIEKRHNESHSIIQNPMPSQHSVMYGNCDSTDTSRCNKPDCYKCTQRIICKDKRGIEI